MLDIKNKTILYPLIILIPVIIFFIILLFRGWNDGNNIIENSEDTQTISIINEDEIIMPENIYNEYNPEITKESLPNILVNFNADNLTTDALNNIFLELFNEISIKTISQDDLNLKIEEYNNSWYNEIKVYEKSLEWYREIILYEKKFMVKEFIYNNIEDKVK